MNKFNMANFTRGARTTFTKHGPGILMGLGVTGMFTMTALAVGATPKALQDIEVRKKELEVEELTPVETVKACWKNYIPAVATGIFSTACIIGSHSTHVRRNAALATAYKLSETAFVEYKDKVIETIGEKKEKNVREKVNKERLEKNPVTQTSVIITDKGNTRCYDPLSGRYFTSNIEKIRRAVNNLNEELLNGMGYVSLNDFYSELILDSTDIGDELGWNIIDGQVKIDFDSLIDAEGTPCVVIEYQSRPRYGYSSYR